MLLKLLGSRTLLVTGHLRQQLESIALHERPFPSHTNPSIFLKVHSNEKGRYTRMNTHRKIHAYLSLAPSYSERKGKRAREGEEGNGGGVTFHHRLANFAKSGLSFPEVPRFLTSSRLQNDCLRPLLPQKTPMTLKKILHCSICQCIGVYPVSCPTDKQMYILMCPGM